MKKYLNNSTNGILIAFFLNFAFSIIELIGGAITNSIAVVSDAVHDMGDTFSIGISLILEAKSRKAPDDKFTFGYIRYSLIGSFITTAVLLCGSAVVIYNAIDRIIHPELVNHQGMIIFAILGLIVNFFATLFTRSGKSLNQKAVNLHMLEDVLGWLVVLIGAILIKFTGITIIDPILSILVALFIFKNAFSNLKTVTDLFLEKAPATVDVERLKEHILKIKGIKNLHHVHVWSIDGYNNLATMHVIINKTANALEIKKQVKEELKEHGISHTTIELETADEHCLDTDCGFSDEVRDINAHHHHH